MIRRLLSFLASACAVLTLSNCSTAPSRNASSGIVAQADRAPTWAKSPMLPCARTGLATEWGSKVDDKVSSTVFERDATKPVGVAKVFYNNAEGARAMAGTDFSQSNSFRDYAAGLFRFGMRNNRGAALSAYQSGGNLICVGEDGQRYSVEVENLSNHRLELVITVDGLDVLSGKPGSYTLRGYVLSPGERREIKGWRTSENEVASFKFGNVDGSYAAGNGGETRNVGVIGTAVFAERGTTPKPYAGTDSYRRLHADPFVVKDAGFSKPPKD